MSDVLIAVKGGGSVSSDELTATANDLLKGKTAVTSDSNDEAVAGTLELTGTASDSQVLAGKTYYSTDAKTKRTGEMVNRGAVSPEGLNAGGSYTIPAGYHNGSGKVTASSLASQTGGATAADGDVLSGKTYWKDGAKRTGTMTNQGAKTSALNCGGSYTIPAGYHNGSGKVTANSLTSQTGVDSGKTAAAAAQILTGYQAWVNGSKITGSMANQGAKTSALNCGGSYTIPAGYHNGSGKVTANSLASQTSATAAAGNILSGKTAWVNGTKITGTLAVQSAISFSAAALSSSSIRISWKNPSKGPWQGVFIQISTSGTPGVSGGTRKYTGAGTNPSQAGGNNYVDITGLSANTTYYFTCVSYTTNLGNGTSHNLSAKTLHKPGMFFAKDHNPYGLIWYPSTVYGSVTNEYFGVTNATYSGSGNEYVSPFRTTKPVGLDLFNTYKKIRLVFERGDADAYFEFDVGFQSTGNVAHGIASLFRMTASGTYTVDFSNRESFYNSLVSSYGKPSFFTFSIFFSRSYKENGSLSQLSYKGGKIKELEFI